MDDREDSSDEEGGGTMVGFLFGNVDQNLQLEDNYLDKEAREHLDALGSSKLGGTLGQLQVVLWLSLTRPCCSHAESGP